MSEYEFDNFNPSTFKLMIMIGVDTNKFPGITEQYMRDAREWLLDDENFDWLLKQRKMWEETPVSAPEEKPTSDMPGWAYKLVIEWGGSDPDPKFNRMWWGEAHHWDPSHGERKWQRKFPLPRWLDDKQQPFLVVYDDGFPFKVNGSQTMQMSKDNRKYRPEDKNERDPRKQHPLLLAPYKAKTKFITLYHNDHDHGTAPAYSTRFHHTQTDGPDGGQSLVLCPGQQKFDRCTVDGHELRYHGTDEGRHNYWNMDKYYDADIICWKDGKKHVFPTDKRAVKGMVFGKCKKTEENT